MKWVSKHPPVYIYLDDEWERESDHKLFKPHPQKRAWLADDGEKIEWHKNAKPMKEKGK